MANPEHQPAPRRSNGARVVLIVFSCVAVLGFLLMAVGFLLRVPICGTVGLLFILIGLLGAIISGIVLASSRSAPARQIPPPAGSSAGGAPGWYPDPENPALLRYFDGRGWTGSTHPRQ